MATLLMWGFIWAVVCRRAGWAGIALGLVALTRLSIVPGATVFALGWWWLLPEASRSAWLQQAFRFLIPIVLAGGILAGYNGVRFGNIFDNGYDYLNDSESIQQRRLEHGTFSPAFFLENLYVATIKPARSVRLDCLGGATRLDNCGWLSPDPIGMGLLWTCPLLLLGWWAGNTRQTWLIALAIGLVMLPALLYHNTGSMQFGYRFIVDALPLWMILLAWSARRIPSPSLPRWCYICILASMGNTLATHLDLLESLHGYPLTDETPIPHLAHPRATAGVRVCLAPRPA
ncbi:MAG UNVERIFIED_CONTAM: hypothetical protein LVT10_24010 [Anaerolineae bacterium]|jgi:hypothetical protein